MGWKTITWATFWVTLIPFAASAILMLIFTIGRLARRREGDVRQSLVSFFGFLIILGVWYAIISRQEESAEDCSAGGIVLYSVILGFLIFSLMTVGFGYAIEKVGLQTKAQWEAESNAASLAATSRPA